jgi:2-aminoethylphosphonate dioxygenase
MSCKQFFLYILSAITIFSLDAMTLEEQRDFFIKYDYVVLRDFFTQEEADKLQMYADKWGAESQQILEENAGDQTSTGRLIVVAECDQPTQVCRVEDLLSYEVDFEYLISARVSPILAELTEEDYVPFKDKLNFKWPGGGAFDAHQDYPAYQNIKPKSFVTAMISIDEATEENGYLYFAGGWKESLKGESFLKNGNIDLRRAIIPYYVDGEMHGCIKKEFITKLDWKGMHTTPRDLVLFNAFLPHYSNKNMSNNSRRAIFITYNKLTEGVHKDTYYKMKRDDPHNPRFHFATPTK